MKNMKKAYLAPMVEVMNARVEKGFAGSGSSSQGNGWHGQNTDAIRAAAARPQFDDFD